MTVVLGSILANGTVTPSVVGDKLSIITKLTFSGEYKTGGDITLGEEIKKLLEEIGRGTIEWVDVTGSPGYVFSYNYETAKLQVFRTGTALKGVLEELPEAEYPALIRTGSQPHLFCIGR